jgi:glucokinase
VSAQLSEAATAGVPMATVVGVDVGGTKVATALMREGRLAEPVLQPTELHSADALIDQLVRQVDAVRERAGDEVQAVGLGIPSVIEWSTGRVRASVNVPLTDVPLREVLRERLGVPVYVDNDATCAALAEAHDDEGRLTAHDLVMITVGTGVGGGIVVDGHVYRGTTGAAAEIGHMLIAADLDADEPALDGFPRPGSLEALASGRALDALARRAASDHPDSPLGRAHAAGETVAGPHCVLAAQDGDEVACAALAVLGRRLGIGIANLVNIFDPDVVAVGGGASAAGELLLGPAREMAARFILPGVGTRTEIRLARSGAGAGVRGAALLASLEQQRQGGRGLRRG